MLDSKEESSVEATTPTTAMTPTGAMTPTSVTDHRRKPRDRGKNKLSIAQIRDSIWLQEDSFIQDQNTQFLHEPLTA